MLWACPTTRASSRHDRLSHQPAGVRRAGGIQGAVGAGFALFHRADAARCSGRHARHRAGWRRQCGAACRQRVGAERPDARQPPRSLAAAPDRKRRRTAEGRRVSEAAPVLQPEATIGILGGGQLGRMLALAAARLGFKCHVFAPSPDSPAFDVVHRVTTADYTDTEALDRFAGDVDVVTYEFENVPAETATFLAARVPVLPDPQVLATTQDRLKEKNFVTGLGFRTAAFADVGAPEALAAAIEH